jgi:hypothetical protein
VSDAWNAFVLTCRDRYGVATPAHARACGVANATFYRRTRREGWLEPYPGVRIAPWVQASPRTDLSALLHAAGVSAAATSETAAWIHGLLPAPQRLQIAVPHHHSVPEGAHPHVRRHRWLRDDDRVVLRDLTVLRIPAMVVTLANRPALALRSLVIDALHRELVGLPELVARLVEVGPVAGRRQLARLLHELADREVESIFHDLVLNELTIRGYQPQRAPVRVATPDGRGVHPDIPLPAWRVAIEVQGDRFHRSRVQRTADRRKTSQYAGSGWLLLEVDWWEWMSNRDHFLAALDAAILERVRDGVAEPRSLPPHLRGLSPRVQNVSPGPG